MAAIVNEVTAPSFTCTEGTGWVVKAGAAFTVRVEALLVAEQTVLVATHRYLLPFKPAVAVTVSVAVVTPLFGGELVRFV